MGDVLAGHLLDAKFPLVIYNRTKEKVRRLESLGAEVADTPKAAAENADIIMSVVADDQASQAIWRGEGGALSSVRPGTILIESSTLSPAWVSELAQSADEKGCALLDAPIAGGREAAQAKQIMFLVGGQTNVLARVQSVLDALSRHTIHAGPSGSGMMLKLTRNLLLGVQMAGLAEVIRLAETAGLDRDITLESIVNGPTASPAITSSVERMMDRKGSTDFALSLLRKDLDYALNEAARLGLNLDTAKAVQNLLVRAEAQGLGNSDMTSMIHAL